MIKELTLPSNKVREMPKKILELCPLCGRHAFLKQVLDVRACPDCLDIIAEILRLAK